MQSLAAKRTSSARATKARNWLLSMTLCSAATLSSTADAKFVHIGCRVPPAPSFQTAPLQGNIRPQFKAALGEVAITADARSRTRTVARVSGHGGDGATTVTAALNWGRQGCHGPSSRQDHGFTTALGEVALSADARSCTRAVARASGHGGKGATTVTAALNWGRQGCHGPSSRQGRRPGRLGPTAGDGGGPAYPEDDAYADGPDDADDAYGHDGAGAPTATAALNCGRLHWPGRTSGHSRRPNGVRGLVRVDAPAGRRNEAATPRRDATPPSPTAVTSRRARRPSLRVAAAGPTHLPQHRSCGG